MGKIKKHQVGLFLITSIILLTYAGVAFSQLETNALDFFEMTNLDERTDGYYSLVCKETGEIIMKTARKIHMGDEYIDQQNRLFQVVKIDKDTAYANYIENIALIKEDIALTGKLARKVLPTQQENSGWIAVYHSHGAESYVPTDGEESTEEGGGILKVGRVFVQSLKEQGIEAVQSNNTHVPHDAGAYNRSRRTVKKFIQKSPDALFDIHRDAVPAQEYAEDVSGDLVTQVLLVVGRQNQNSANNRQFAEGLKSSADELYPGLVKGILMARGNYNQDMSSRSLLLEIGSHENNREEAEKAAVLFSEVVNTYLYGGEGTGAGMRKDIMTREGSASVLATVIVAIFVLAGIGFFLLVSTGNWEEFRRKAISFFQREFNDLKGHFNRVELESDKSNDEDN